MIAYEKQVRTSTRFEKSELRTASTLQSPHKISSSPILSHKERLFELLATPSKKICLLNSLQGTQNKSGKVIQLEPENPQSELKNNSYLDRFIPCRKNTNYEMIMNVQYEEMQNQMPDERNNKLNELYRKHVLRIAQKQQNNFENQNLFKFKLSPKKIQDYNLVINQDSSPAKIRKINKLPCKVLDAPALQDDFYLNLIHWSDSNVLAVGLANSVYLWGGNTGKVSKLCDLGTNDLVTSVCFSQKSNIIGVGTNNGQVQIWDYNKLKIVSKFKTHISRIGAMAWKGNMVTSGSRDKSIINKDISQNSSVTSSKCVDQNGHLTSSNFVQVETTTNSISGVVIRNIHYQSFLIILLQQRRWPGHHINTDCWHQVVEQLTGQSVFGIL